VNLKKKKITKRARRLKNPDSLEKIEEGLKKAVKKKPKKKPYFGKDAHNAVVEYQNTDVRKEKHKIYEDKIRPSFEKLAENLIFIHSFSTSKEHFEVLKSDTVSFLYEILEKFDPARGSKAFSYFNVCAKNFLIIQSKKRIKNKIRHISMNDDSLSASEKYQIERHQVIPSSEDMYIRFEDIKLLHEMIDKIRSRVTNQNEILCIEAVNTLFKNIDELDFLNKRAIFVYLREISGLNAKQLSVSMSNIRKHYRELKGSNFEYELF
tara:strand:+ start:1035 stop:1829 length:795 start_codon:yes stop_codon:yes gene_type:complete